MRLRNPLTNKIPKNIRLKELQFARFLPRKNEFLKSEQSLDWKQRGPFNVGGRTRALAIDITNENIILAGGATGGMWRSTDGGQSFYKTTSPKQLHSVTCIAQDKRKGKQNIWYYGTGEYFANVNASGFVGQLSGDGIFKSTNGGKSWEQLPATISSSPTNLYNNFDCVWKIVVDSHDTINDVVYAAVFNGIYRSSNGGLSWTPVLGFDSTNYAEYTDIDISSKGVLYATLSSPSKYKGIWRSEDGIHWTNISPPFKNVADSSGWPENFRRTCIGIAPSNENKVFFITQAITNIYANPKEDENCRLWSYNYISGDGSGNNGIWENKSMNIPVYNCRDFFDFELGNYRTQWGYDMYIKVKPDDENVVFLGGTNIYRSTDGFSSKQNCQWVGGYICNSANPSDYNYPNHHPDQHELVFFPSNPNIALSGHDGGISKTFDCMRKDSIHWIYLNNGYNTTQFYTTALEPGNTNSQIIVGGMQDNGTWFTNSSDPKKEWESVLYGDGSYCAISHNRKNYYLSWQSGKTLKFKIDDNGKVLGKTRIDPLGADEDYYLFINPFILDPNDDNKMYLVAYKNIWRNDSLDKIPINNDEYNRTSIGWTRIGKAYTGIDGGFITALNMPLLPKNTLFYGTSNAKLYVLENANTSNPVRRDITSSLFPNNAYISCIATNKFNGNEIIVTFSNYGVRSIFYSNDGGKNWQSISGNLEEFPDGSGNGPSVNWAEIYQTNNSTIYFVATSIGLFSTTKLDGDATIWTQEAPNTIGNVVVNSISSRPYDGTIIVGTYGAGVFSAQLPVYTYISDNVYNKPKDFILEQNYPNPFQKITQIRFSIPISTYVQIKIFDMGGKLINILKDNYLQYGTYSLSWDGKDKNGNILPAGTYFCVMSANDKRISKRMLFLK
jgi:hypothetical protein